MSTDNNFFLQLMASHPFVQEYAHLDDETYEYVRSSHPAVAHILDACREIVEAVGVGYNVPKPERRPWNIVKAVDVGRDE